ncbi:MAG TPA: SIMPL domain-containing protein [Pseudonocardiaceae bacterium]
MSESIDMPWGASVFGAASVQAAPDIARLSVTISQTRPQPTEAFDVVRTRIARVRQTIRDHDIPDSAVSVSQLNVKSSWRIVNGEHVFEGYGCSASISIELSELDTLESLLVDVVEVEAGANTVDGVRFDVRAKQQLRARARSAAVAAAREKAVRYAEAAGVRLGPVLHIKDIDPEYLRAGRSHGYAASRSEDGDLAPGNVSVSAGVVLGFSLVAA